MWSLKRTTVACYQMWKVMNFIGQFLYKTSRIVLCRLKTYQALLILAPIFSQNVSALSYNEEPMPYTGTPEMYPECSQPPLNVTEENYKDKYLSLAGLTGLHIVFDYIEGGSRKNNVILDPELIHKIRARLQKAGLALLTKEEMQMTPGQPKMEIYPNFPISQVGKYGISSVENSACCTAGIWVSYFEGASTLRQPNTHYVLSTWGQGDNTHDCSSLGEWMSIAVLRKIDSFIMDFERAQKHSYKEQDFLSKNNMDSIEGKCSKSKTIYSNMFKTGSYQFSKVHSPELNQLADTIKQCPNYRFLIDAHADTRATPSFNQALSEKRSQAIKFYLLSKNVPISKFETQGQGERFPIAHGNSQKDHAMNRRIEVTPFKIY